MNRQSDRVVTILRQYQSAYPDPLILKPGDDLKVQPKESEWSGWIWCVSRTGQAGWVPESFVERTDESCRLIREYNGTELTVNTGERVTVLAEESGWFWCVNQTGLYGWIPIEVVDPTDSTI
jgi:hypothetical protein